MAVGLNVINKDDANSDGIYGIASNFGVYGSSDKSYGVFGNSAGYSGVYGSSTNGFGVSGNSTNRTGVAGTSTNGVGAAGYSTKNIGVWGLGNPGGFFIGGLITWMGPKSTTIRSRDGSHRLLYCVESPESWFEDFGRARLVRGKAEVRLDAAFAAAVRTDDYHIFLSPEGNCAGLYVSRRSRAGFQVREQGHGTSTVAFSYRIVARRKDIEAPRFAKLPKHLDPAHLKKTLKAFKPPKPLKPPKLPKLPEVPRVPQAPNPPKRRGPARGRGAHSNRMRGSATA